MKKNVHITLSIREILHTFDSDMFERLILDGEKSGDEYKSKEALFDLLAQGVEHLPEIEFRPPSADDNEKFEMLGAVMGNLENLGSIFPGLNKQSIYKVVENQLMQLQNMFLNKPEV